jgi:hypothetical protein
MPTASLFGEERGFAAIVLSVPNGKELRLPPISCDERALVLNPAPFLIKFPLIFINLVKMPLVLMVPFFSKMPFLDEALIVLQPTLITKLPPLAVARSVLKAMQVIKASPIMSKPPLVVKVSHGVFGIVASIVGVAPGLITPLATSVIFTLVAI